MMDKFAYKYVSQLRFMVGISIFNGKATSFMGIQPTRSNYFLYPQIVEAKDKPLDFKILIVGY